jgi:hypothetical protein
MINGWIELRLTEKWLQLETLTTAIIISLNYGRIDNAFHTIDEYPALSTQFEQSKQFIRWLHQLQGFNCSYSSIQFINLPVNRSGAKVAHDWWVISINGVVLPFELPSYYWVSSSIAINSSMTSVSWMLEHANRMLLLQLQLHQFSTIIFFALLLTFCFCASFSLCKY